MAETNGESLVKVTVLQAVNVQIEGQSTALSEGQEIRLPPEQAEQLAGLGYVSPPGGDSSPPGGSKLATEPSKSPAKK